MFTVFKTTAIVHTFSFKPVAFRTLVPHTFIDSVIGVILGNSQNLESKNECISTVLFELMSPASMTQWLSHRLEDW